MSYPKEEERKVAQNFSDYLEETKEMKDMFVWVWEKLVSSEGKKASKHLFILIFISSIIAAFVPISYKYGIDGLIEHSKYMFIGGVVAYFVIRELENFVGYFSMKVREFLLGNNSQSLNYNISKMFLEKPLGMHISENNNLNDSNIRKGYDKVTNIQKLLLFDGVEGMLGIFVPFIAIWFFDLKVALIVTAMLVLHIVWSLLTNQKIIREGLPIDKDWRYSYRYRVERWNNPELVKNNAKEDDELKEINRLHLKALIPDRKLWYWFLGQISKRGGCHIIGLTAIFAFSANSVWIGANTVGWLMAIMAWVDKFYSHMWHFGHLEHQINEATPSVMSMKNALSMKSNLYIPNNPVRLSKNTPCKIEFKNVSHYYVEKIQNSNKKKEMSVLHNVNFTIEPGQKVALIGKSGAGKTTIMQLLLRYGEPKQGSVLIDDKDLRMIELSSWLNILGYVPQEPAILSGTMEYNIKYPLSNADREKISNDEFFSVVKDTQCNFEGRLIDGLQTRVGFKGIKLSGGQRQRLSIARAAIKRPRFLLIDEATSSLDPTTERLVQEGLERLLNIRGRNSGALIITHRLNTVKRLCSKGKGKFVMIGKRNHQGSEVLAEAGSFEELFVICPEFRELAIDQEIKFCPSELKKFRNLHWYNMKQSERLQLMYDISIIMGYTKTT